MEVWWFCQLNQGGREMDIQVFVFGFWVGGAIGPLAGIYINNWRWWAYVIPTLFSAPIIFGN